MDTQNSVWDNLSERQIQAINYKLQHPDAPYTEIAEAVGLTQGALQKWGLNDLVRQVLLERRKATEGLIAHSSIEAVRTLQAQLSHEDGKVAQGAAKLLLAYYLGNPSLKVDVSGSLDSQVTLIDMRHLTFEQLKELKDKS